MKHKVPLLILFVLAMVWPMHVHAQSGGNIIVNGDFSSGSLAPWSTFLADWEGANATFTVADNKVSITGLTSNLSASWHVQLNQILTPSQIGALEIGQTYRIAFTADAEAARPINVYFGEDGGGFTAIILETVELDMGSHDYEAIIEVGQTFDNMKFGFELGLNNTSVSITNVSLAPYTPAKNIIVNGDFSSGELAPWSTFLADWEGASGTFTVEDNRVNITGLTSNLSASWHVQLNQVFTPSQIGELEIGKTYEVIFTADAAAARPINVYFGEDGGGFTALALETIELAQGLASYSFAVEVTQTFDNMKFGFELGLNNTDVSITDVVLTDYVPNIIENGDFSSGELAPWSTFVADFAGAAATFTVADNKASITGITIDGSQSWHVQLNQVLTPSQIGMLTVGETYKISFTAEAEAERPVNVYFGEDGGGFTAIVLEEVTLPAGASDVSVEFVVSQTFENMKLGFEYGLSNVNTTLTNVVLRQSTGTPTGPSPAPVMEQNFIFFAAGGKHISIPSIPQGTIVNDPAINDVPVLKFDNGNWTIGGFDWGNRGVNVAERRTAQDSVFIRIWSSPENHSDQRAVNNNNTVKLHFLDIGEEDNLEFRVQLELPDEIHIGQWLDIAIPLPAFLTKTELENAKTAGTLTGYAALWDYWGAYSVAREEVISDVEDEDWREFNWERVRRIGIYWDQFPIPGAPVYIEHLYIGRSGNDLTVATQGPSSMGTVTGVNMGGVNRLSWAPNEDIFSYGVFYSSSHITNIDDPNVMFWATIPGDVTEVEHPVYQPHPALGTTSYYYAIAPGNAWGVLSKNVSNSAVQIVAQGQPSGYIFQLTPEEEAGVFNALDLGQFPGLASFPKESFEPVRLRTNGEVNDFWLGPEDSQADVWVAYGTADGFNTLFFYGEVYDDDVLGGPAGNLAAMTGTTIYPRCCVGDFEAVTWVPGVGTFDDQLEWNYYLKDQLVVEFGAYLVDDYVTGSTNKMRTRGETPEYLLAFQPYFSHTGSVDITGDPDKMLVRLWVTEPLDENYVPSPGEIPRDYNSLYYSSQHPLTTPAVYENIMENGVRVGWRFFAAVDSQDLLAVTEGGVPVDAELTLPGSDELAFMPMTMQLWDKDGGAAPGNWWETATTIIQFPTKPWGFSAAVNSADISGMGALAVAGREVPTSNENRVELPEKLQLFQNYPNPFNPNTTIQFQLPEAARVKLTVYNSIGQRVAVLANGTFYNSGRHTVTFNAGSFSSGVYFYRLETGNQVLQRKMVLVK